MQKIQSLLKLSSFITSSRQYFTILIVFLFLMGTHMLDYYPWVFIFIGIFLVTWKDIPKWETLLLIGFILSVFITWYFLDPSILFHHVRLLGQFTLLFMMYMIGLSFSSTQKNNIRSMEKNFFYFLFIFFIGYMFSIIYSYLFIMQDYPLTKLGMYVCFQNEYKQAHINGGKLISTILTYYLTFMAILLPFILLYFKTFKKYGFSTISLMFLSGISIFSIYLTSEMGRRTTIVLLIVISCYLFIAKIVESWKIINTKILFLFLFGLIFVAGVGYYFLADSPVIHRLASSGLNASRYGYWLKGIYVMNDYPFGGGYNVYISSGMKLAHNTWIDIGKDLGVIPFILFVLLLGVFVYYIVRILFNKEISIFIKHTVMILSITLFTILMIEPVFNSDKTFFSYSMFLLGALITLNNKEKIK